MARLALTLLLCFAETTSVAAPKSATGGMLRLSGHYAEARRVLEAEVAREPKALAARLELGLVYRATGERALAEAIWNRFFDDYEQGRIDKTNAKELSYVARAAEYLGSFEDANETFRDAVKADPKGSDGARANIAWAELFLEKYDAGHAEVSLDEALKILPDDPDAHVVMARVKLEQGYDVEGAEKELATALKKRPRHLGALEVKAQIALEDQQLDETDRQCRAILAINPEDLRAREIVAAAALLRGDERGYRTERDQVLKTNPHASAFFHGVAEFLVREHRYLEANDLEREALKADPKDPIARAAIGANFLRLGDDKAGLEALQAAWKGDPYNVRSFNLLKLFEEVIPKDYTMIDGTPFRFRVPKAEREVLLASIRPMLQREYAEMTKRYGFVPKGPLTLEIFTDPEHYAVRTVGLPGLDALAVSFGSVVTAMSPKSGKFNWGMTLWHEVAHLFSIQLSRSRVPRWFTEGLAEYETARFDPTWTRRTNGELFHALERGQLLSVADLNRGFTRAKDVAHIVVAYHEAAEAVGFLARRWGFPTIVEALKRFAEGDDTSQAIRRVTGLDVAAFDAAFREDLRTRLAPYAGTFFVRSTDYSDVEALKERLKTHPDDQRSKGLYALALVKGRAGEEASQLIEKDLHDTIQSEDAKKKREIILAAAELALLRKDRAAAKFFFAGLVPSGGDGYDARFGLGTIAVADGDVAEAEKQLTLAKKYDPDRAEPYLLLARLYDKSRPEDAIRELEAASRLDVMDGLAARLLVEKIELLQRWPALITAAERALYIAPFDAKVRAALARAHLELGHKEEARAQLALARACEPERAIEAELKALSLRLR